MVANTMPAPKPAFKVAAMGPSGRGGRRPSPSEFEAPRNPWEKYQLKFFPKKINGKWYKPGSWVYRKFVMTPGGGYYKYGDDFDYMRGR